MATGLLFWPKLTKTLTDLIVVLLFFTDGRSSSNCRAHHGALYSPGHWVAAASQRLVECYKNTGICGKCPFEDGSEVQLGASVLTITEVG